MNNKKLRIMEAFKRFKEVANMEKMTFEQFKTIQKETTDKLKMLAKDKAERIQLCMRQRDERVNKLRLLLAEKKNELNTAIQDLELGYKTELKIIEAEYKSECIEQSNIREMAKILFARQIKHEYPEIPNEPAIIEDSLTDIEPDVELDMQEGGDDE